MDPFVSVIIPVYNRPAILPRAIRSVLSQTGVDLELIVVDDGSTDDTCRNATMPQAESNPDVETEVIHVACGVWPCGSKQYPLRTFYCADNRGPSAARNLGIKHSKGEWIAFLDSDDEWLPGKLKAQIDFFKKNPDCLICQTEEIWIRNGKRVNPMKKHKKYGGYIFEKCLPLCIVSPSAVMMHRRLFDEVGLFDESLPACEDYDLWLRIAARYPIGLIEKPSIIKYGGHADQRSREFPAMDLFRIRSLSKLLRSDILTAEQTLATRRMLEEKSRIFIQGALKRGKEEEAATVKNLLDAVS